MKMKLEVARKLRTSLESIHEKNESSFQAKMEEILSAHAQEMKEAEDEHKAQIAELNRQVGRPMMLSLISLGVDIVGRHGAGYGSMGERGRRGVFSLPMLMQQLGLMKWQRAYLSI